MLTEVPNEKKRFEVNATWYNDSIKNIQEKKSPFRFETVPSPWFPGSSERCIEIPWALSRYAGQTDVLEVGLSLADLTLVAGQIVLQENTKCHLTALDIVDIDRVRNRFINLNADITSIFKFVQGDARNSPFPNESFDLIFIISTIEHIGFDVFEPDSKAGTVFKRPKDLPQESRAYEACRDDRKVLSELKRILKPGGSLLLTVPMGSGGIVATTDSKNLYCLHKEYTASEWDLLLQDSGLIVAEERFFRDAEKMDGLRKIVRIRWISGREPCELKRGPWPARSLKNRNKLKGIIMVEDKDYARQTSVVICVKNAESIIKPALESVLKNGPKDITVVDGMSTDRTEEIVKSMNIPFLSDHGKGLAFARRVGVENARGQWVLFVGPDNILPENFINEFVSLKEKWGFQAASAQTRILSPKTYWDRGGDFRWFCIMGEPGPRTVVGTPSIYDRKLFNDVKFSEEDISACDDTDVAEQLLAKGHKLGVVPLLVHEHSGWTMEMVWKRYRWYGTGDYFFYRRYHKSWTLGRKIKSLSHPLRQTFRCISLGFRQGRWDVAPWLLLTAAARYKGWIEFALAKRMEEKKS